MLMGSEQRIHKAVHSRRIWEKKIVLDPMNSQQLLYIHYCESVLVRYNNQYRTALAWSESILSFVT